MKLPHAKWLCYYLVLCIQRANSTISQEILNWWKSVSMQKPLNCQMNHEFTDELQPSTIASELLQDEFRLPYVYFRKCGVGELIEWGFKGKTVDGVPDGPGKLKFNKPLSEMESEEAKENGTLCTSRYYFRGYVSKEIIGTFKNGKLVGVGKVQLDNGMTLVADFKDGEMNGLIRIWDAQGNLSELWYKNIFTRGHAWVVHNQTLVWFPNNAIAEDAEELSVVIPMNETNQEIWAGDYDPIMGLLTNIHTVDLELMSQKTCSLNLKMSLKEKQDFVYQFGNGHKIKHQEVKCKLSGSTAEEQYKNWMSDMNEPLSAPNYGIENYFKLKQLDIPIQHEKVKQPFMTQVRSIPGRDLIIEMSNWNGPLQNWTISHPRLNTKGQLHGHHVLKLQKEALNQTGVHNFLNWSPKIIAGRFINGKLSGLALVQTWIGSAIYATFVQGEMHGPCFTLGVVPILEIDRLRGFVINKKKSMDELFGTGGIGFYGHMLNGQVSGPFWAGMLQKSHLVGMASSNGQISGDNIAYIYPDGVTAFKGTFENKFMKKAWNVDVEEYECHPNGLLMPKKFSSPLSDQEFYYEPSTNESFGGGAPLGVRDPYEVKTVKLDKSAIPGSGEGVFLIRDIPSDTPACMYSLFLYRYPDQEERYRETCTLNITKSDDYRRHCKKYSLGTNTFGGTIDLPPELDKNPLPNLGPKVNHHFRDQNSGYVEMEHPRWGLISSVTTMRDMKAGEELFTFYGYGKNDFPADFPWYFEAKLALEREERIIKEAEERAKKIKAKKSKKKNNIHNNKRKK